MSSVALWSALGIGGLLLLIAGRAPAVVHVPIKFSKENQEWLARMLMVEQSAYGRDPPLNEWAGIAWVAINRTASSGRSIKEVLMSGWFGGDVPARLMELDLLSKGNGPRALRFAEDILNGKVSNPIGKRAGFVHPKALRSCEDEGVYEADRLCVQTRHGLRMIPLWAVSKSVGGAAKHEPVEHGDAVFAEYAEL